MICILIKTSRQRNLIILKCLPSQELDGRSKLISKFVFPIFCAIIGLIVRTESFNILIKFNFWNALDFTKK